MSLAAIILVALAIAIAAVAAVAVARAGRGSAEPVPAPLPPEALEAAAGVEDKLAALVRRPTVSRFDPAAEEGEHFAALVKDLEALFPRVHASIGRELVGDRALLYTWEGSDPSLAPVMLCAHYDVVPAEDAAEWKRPPFSGEIADGFVWGRGTQDIKLTLASILFSAERLLSEGFAPKRTVYFAFGGDEEVGGVRGAREIGRLLERRGVRVAYALDEGGPVSDGFYAIARRFVALVAVAEKGYMDVELEAVGKGGHASMPPRRTVSGDLSRAVAAIEASREKARLTVTARALFKAVSSYSGFGYRLLFRNLWLSEPLVKASLSAAPTTNALIRTTVAPTMLQGSSKENVLADRARAILNVRVLPGDSCPAALARISRVAERFGAVARPAHPDAVVEPSPESPVDAEGFRAIEAAMSASFPEAACVPYLLSGGTDTKHYLKVADAVYRVTPALQTMADLPGIHGRDERIGVDNLRRCAVFYRTLMSSL